MTALSADFMPPMAGEDVIPKLGSIGCKAASSVYKGAIVVRDASGGVGRNGYTATGLVALGVCVEHVDNSAGAAKAVQIKYESGVFGLANSTAGDAIADTEIGADCYIVDDATVAKTDGTSTRSRAGKVVRIENSKVFVLIGIGV